MNRKPHQAIIVTGTDEKILQRLKDRAETLFLYVSELSRYGLGLLSFFIPPYESLANDAVDSDQLRDDFVDWLRAEGPDVDWVEVNFGEGGSRDRVTRSSRISGLANNATIKIQNVVWSEAMMRD